MNAKILIFVTLQSDACPSIKKMEPDLSTNLNTYELN